MVAVTSFSTAQSQDPRRLEDRVGGRRILLTGASSGIGREALRLGSARAIVALVARRAEQLELVAADIARVGGRARVYPTDLSHAEEVDALVLRVEESSAAWTCSSITPAARSGVPSNAPMAEFATTSG